MSINAIHLKLYYYFVTNEAPLFEVAHGMFKKRFHSATCVLDKSNAVSFSVEYMIKTLCDLHLYTKLSWTCTHDLE